MVSYDDRRIGTHHFYLTRRSLNESIDARVTLATVFVVVDRYPQWQLLVIVAENVHVKLGRLPPRLDLVMSRVRSPSNDVIILLVSISRPLNHNLRSIRADAEEFLGLQICTDLKLDQVLCLSDLIGAYR